MDKQLAHNFSTQPASAGHDDAAAVSFDGGTKDGDGAGDHDQPFHGFRAYHFHTRQMLRLLDLRSALLDARMGIGRFGQDVDPA